MGRAKSNTKRRPKGKRGWRKIDANAFINPPQETSLEEEQDKITQLRDSQLWSQDVTPRKIKKLTKAQKKLKAKRKLLSRGFAINSIDANQKLNQQIVSYQRNKRLSSFKERQHCKKYNQNHTIPKQPKQTAILTFKNKTTKKVLLPNHKHIASNKKNIKNNTDYHLNNPYNLYKAKHGKANTHNAPVKDLWSEKKSSRKQITHNNDSSSYSETESDDNDSQNNEDATDLPDVKPWDIITAQRKASKCEVKGNRSVHNPFVPNVSVLSLPQQGESINPMAYQYYYLKWKALELQAQQLFKKQYQKKSTQRWHKENLKVRAGEDDRIKELRTKANKMHKLYLKHKKQYHNGQRANGEENDGEEMSREISKRQKVRDVRMNRKNYKTRMNAVRLRMKLCKKNGGHIYGSKYRFKRRATPVMAASKMGNCLRTTVHTGTDHPLSFMFNEMQRQNKIHGSRRHRFVLPKKKAFLGPRFKVQTRIGKLHHANVDNKYFTGIDDL
eukprot:492528_1